jgi:hypothetical protein
VESLVDTVERLAPDLVVVSGTTKRRLTPLVEPLTPLRQKTRVALAGAGAKGGIEGLQTLDGDPVTAAASV